MHDPRMSENVIKRQASSRIVYKELGDEIAGSTRNMRREGQVDSGNAAEGGTLSIGNEGSVTGQEFVGQDSERPNINVRVVRLALDHLRRQVVQSAAHGLTTQGRGVDRPSKVSELHFALQTEKKIFRLDIAVNDVLAVEILESVGNAADVVSAELLREASGAVEFVVEFSLSGVLQDQIDLLAVVEVAI